MAMTPHVTVRFWVIRTVVAAGIMTASQSSAIADLQPQRQSQPVVSLLVSVSSLAAASRHCRVPIQDKALPKPQPLLPHKNGRGGTDIAPTAPGTGAPDRRAAPGADAPSVEADPPQADGCPYRSGEDLDLLV